MSIKGIDVSYYQGTIDWQAVAQDGIQFAMVRASYGQNSVDSKFSQNVKNALANGIEVGAYHYCYATTLEAAEAEAKHFLATVKDYTITYPLVLDIEDSSQTTLSQSLLTDICQAFLQIIEAAGYYAMIYSSRSWFENVLDDSRLKAYDHWVAEWSKENTYRGQSGMWQYADNGSISGITGYVDLDYSYNDYAAIIKRKGLNNLTPNPDPKPKPEPEPELDNTPDAYAAAAVAKAVAEGVIVGDATGNWHLHDYCTRQDVVVMLDRAGLLD